MEASIDTLAHIAETVSLKAISSVKNTIICIIALGYPVGNETVEYNREVSTAKRFLRDNRDVISVRRSLDEIFTKGAVELFVGLLVDDMSIVPHISCVLFAIKKDGQIQIIIPYF